MAAARTRNPLHFVSPAARACGFGLCTHITGASARAPRPSATARAALSAPSVPGEALAWPAMTRPISKRAVRSALLAVPVMLTVAGCGSGTTATTSREAFTAQTSTGLSYVLETTVQGTKQCTSTTIRAALPNGKPGIETSSSCGAAGVAHPLLVQAKSSSESILVDSPRRRARPSRVDLRTRRFGHWSPTAAPPDP